MIKKPIMFMILLLLMLFVIPIASANDAVDNVTDSVIGIEENSEITDELSVNPEDDFLSASQTIYFNSSAEVDGDGSQSKPYKYLTSQRIGSGKILVFANGEYELSKSLSISSATFYGEDASKTIINLDNHKMSTYNNLVFNNLTLKNLFIENTAGTVTATNVIFTNCVAAVRDGYDGSFGGAIGCFVRNSGSEQINPTLYITNCTFINNTAVYGGAIFMESGTLNITDSRFENNHADNFGGAIGLFPGSTAIIENTVFVNDYSTSNAGGAVYAANSNLTFNNNTIQNCSATFGGGICDLKSSVKISLLMALNNTANYEGGVIYKMYGTITISNSKFNNNKAKNGGAIFVDDSESFSLRFNDFIKNSAAICGGAVYSIFNNKTNFLENNYVDNTAIIEVNMYSSDSYSLQIGSGDYIPVSRVEEYNGTLPSRYNLIDDGYVTPIADQQKGGNCWAFSSIATVESCLLKATNLTYDLSEENMKNLIALFSDYGWNMETNNGGYDEMAIAYLTSWLGPVNESSDRYDDYSRISPILNSIFHIQNILYLGRESYTDNDAIKRAIMSYGAVSTGIYYSNSYMSSKNAYYYPYTEFPANHAVSIVGWDDNYSKNNFRTTPPGNGAWIAKNSWGESWADNGYFYVSYYDKVFTQVGDPHFSYTIIFNDTIKLDKNYQYDISGITDYFITGKNTIWYKNVFNATDDELLAAFSTYFNTTTDWEAYIYVNDELKLVQNGTSVSGYFTFNLNQFVPLSKGDTFAVVLKISADKYASFPISEDVRFARTLYSPGNSFFSFDGEEWYDLYNYSCSGYGHIYSSQTACIKAFTMFDEIPTSIFMNNVTTYVQNPTNIVAKVIDAYGNPVNGGIVTFVVDNVTYQANVTNGFANINVSFSNFGNYEIFASYSADSLFSSSNTTANAEVLKLDVNLSIDIDDVLTYENIPVNVSLYAFNGNPINGTVILTIKGKEYNLNVINGTSLFFITDYLNGGVYEAIAFYNGSDLFYNSTCSDNFTVSLRSIDINLTTEIINVKNVLFNIALSDSINGTLITKLNNESYELNYTDGITSLYLANMPYTNYTFEVIFEKEGYINKTVTDSFELKPTKTHFISSDIIKYYNDGTEFVATLLDENDTVLTNRTVQISINGSDYTRITDENGSFSITLDLNNGNYSIIVNYAGNDIYEPCQASNNIEVLPTILANDIVKYYKNDTQFYATLLDYNGTPLANKNVNVAINGVSYIRTTNEEGTLKFSINLSPGEYVVTVFNPVTGEQSNNNVTVLSRLTDNHDLVKYYRNDSQYSLKVLDKQGNPLSGGTVMFNINGVFYYKVSDENGIVTLNINLSPGKYIITAEYDGCRVSNDITVLSRLTDNHDLVKYYRNDSQYSLKVLDKQGNPLSGGTVMFNINGVFYYKVSDENGIVTLNINLAPGNYIITAEYDGCRVSNDITVLSTIVSKDLEMHYKDGSKFEAQVLDGSGKPNPNQNVVFNVNGVLYERISNADGMVSLNINLQVGKYIITSMYNNLRQSNTITIS